MQLLPALNQGGVERGTLDIARALVEAGHDSIVVSAGGRLVKQLEAEGSTHLRLDIGRKSLATFFKAFALARLIRQHRPDIVHVRSRLPAWVLRLALKRIPIFERPKVVSTLHGMNSVSRYSKIMTRADQLIAVSQTCLDYWKAHYPDVDFSSAQVIHRGIDPKQFKSAANDLRQQLGVPTDDLVVAFPGRITPWKGHRDLIEVAKRAPANTRFWVIGEGKPGSRFEAEIRDAAKGLPIEFLGHRSDIAELLSAADVTLSLTSTTMESFGRVPVESIACGTPVIAYDHGAVGETLMVLSPDGLVKVGQVKDVVTKLRDLPKLKPVTHRFTLEAMVSETLELYQALLKPRVANIMLSRDDGGLQRVSRNYVNTLEKIGMLSVGILSSHGSEWRQLAQDPRYRALRTKGPFVSSSALRTLLKEKRCTHVICHGRRASEMALRSGFPVEKIIPVIHSKQIKWLKPFRTAVYLAEHQRAKLQQISHLRLIKIPNTLNMTPPELLKERIEKDLKRIIFVGRLHPIKRPELAIDLIKDLPSCHLDIFGEGELEEELQRKVAELNLQPRVTFRGWEIDPRKIYDADLLIMTSESEQNPMVLLEAHLFGVPFMATKSPGVVELSMGRRGAYIFNPSRPIAAQVMDTWSLWWQEGLSPRSLSEITADKDGPLRLEHAITEALRDA